MDDGRAIRFTLLDGMALIAAVGAGLWLDRFLAEQGANIGGTSPFWTRAEHAWAVALPITWALAARGVIGARSARPPEPLSLGAATCIAVVMTTLVMVLTVIYLAWPPRASLAGEPQWSVRELVVHRSEGCG